MKIGGCSSEDIFLSVFCEAEHFPSGSLPEKFFSGIMRDVAGDLHAEREKNPKRSRNKRNSTGNIVCV